MTYLREDIQVISKKSAAVMNFDFVIAKGKTIAVTYHVIGQMISRYHEELADKKEALVRMKDLLDESELVRKRDQEFHYENDGMRFVLGPNEKSKYRIVTCYQVPVETEEVLTKQVQKLSRGDKIIDSDFIQGIVDSVSTSALRGKLETTISFQDGTEQTVPRGTKVEVLTTKMEKRGE